MAYENRIAIEACVKDTHKQQGTEHLISNMIKELDEVYNKAKAFDEIEKYKHNIMAVKEISLTHATDEPFNTDMYSVHSLVDNLLDVIDELERE